MQIFIAFNQVYIEAEKVKTIHQENEFLEEKHSCSHHQYNADRRDRQA